MELNDIPTPKLRCILRATERDAGSDSMEALVLRRELTKRQHMNVGFCSTCAFWDSDDYLCRRYAPLKATIGPYVWPGTVESDWCGEWESCQEAEPTVSPGENRLLDTCEFLMARCRDEGLDVVGGAYETEFQHAHQTIAKAKK